MPKIKINKLGKIWDGIFPPSMLLLQRKSLNPFVCASPGYKVNWKGHCQGKKLRIWFDWLCMFPNNFLESLHSSKSFYPEGGKKRYSSRATYQSCRSDFMGNPAKSAQCLYITEEKRFWMKTNVLCKVPEGVSLVYREKEGDGGGFCKCCATVSKTGI